MDKHILYCADRNYFPYVMVSLRSLLINSQNPQHFIIHFFVDEDTYEHHPWFIQLHKTTPFQYSFYNLSTLPELTEGIFLKGYQSLFTYARLFYDKILPPSIKNVLYLDVDTLITGDIDPLFRLNLNTSSMAAVIDLTSKNRVLNRKALQLDEFTYFSAGVLLLNRDQWKSIDIPAELNHFISNQHYIQHAIMNDQDFINIIFKNRIDTLPPIYNAMTLVKPLYETPGYTVCNTQAYPEFKNNVLLKKQLVIRHFVGKFKPWQFRRILFSFKGNLVNTCHHVYIWYQYQRFFMSKKERVFFYGLMFFSLPCRLIAALTSPMIIYIKRRSQR